MGRTLPLAIVAMMGLCGAAGAQTVTEVDLPGVPTAHTATPHAPRSRHAHNAVSVPVDLRQALKHSDLPTPVAEDVAAAIGSWPRDRLPLHLSVAYDKAGTPAAIHPSAHHGAPTRTAERAHLVALTVTDGRTTRHIYRYQTEDGGTALLGDDGRGTVRLALGRPIATDNITSPYGWRIHPVFGDRRFHKGVDFGAPEGTPVVAAADGKVADMGRRGNYGLYLRLAHLPGVETAYAHLSRLAKWLKPGETVHKGQVVGYVGRTGVATGPHLYYEVILNGDRVNPERPPATVPVHLAGRAYARFKAFVHSIHFIKPAAHPGGPD